ncbi:2-amino-4-hydroxy-6-hydroxymethyldihydropteridine pyrophosphokinase [Cohnella kolymensis]|uniref:2-amino-4-hydroxy-6-hydroxymethyldihydropteridine diphosphokinase n=1 Tax=Cohnella kolymensis TaxID=1590652 RepID=A0ABR5A3J3_9BACL|nr:2-amino-4-hydroxy-6-hydroxymethyldihydropteridine diphosphokinase [Cohnella kolymensis]KIL34977.1 2-amino-4-hydroxy-6-hydroxymethyldihydropteridine pyrophosphokinase [Cohnella kolymensis]
MQEAYVALGANIGDRAASLTEAVRRIADERGLDLRRMSPIYETAPVGFTNQPSFLNMTVCLGTDLEPLELLHRLLGIEQEMGRIREVRWGPRNIDLDLLLYGQVQMETPELTLPHPRMGERAFVLVPLHDIWPAREVFPWEAELKAFSVEKEGITRWAVWDGQRIRKES